MATIHELKGSGDFTTGPTGTTGTLRYLVFGTDITSQSLAGAAVDNDTYAPATINSIPRGSIRVSQEAPTYYVVEVEYSGNVREEAGANDGADPGPDGPQEGAGNPAGGVPGTQEVNGLEFSFSTGGGTQRIYRSLATKHKVGRNQAGAPSFNRLIGVSKNGLEGCEVFSREGEFNVTKRYAYATVGYILRLFALTGTVNELPFYGCAAGEVVFKGADGSYRGGDPNPWTISGRFGYQPNWTEDELDISDDIEIPSCDGWDYVWTYNEQTTEVVGAVTYLIERPKFAYVEQVYKRKNFGPLNMDI